MRKHHSQAQSGRLRGAGSIGRDSTHGRYQARGGGTPVLVVGPRASRVIDSLGPGYSGYTYNGRASEVPRIYESLGAQALVVTGRDHSHLVLGGYYARTYGWPCLAVGWEESEVMQEQGVQWCPSIVAMSALLPPRASDGRRPPDFSHIVDTRKRERDGKRSLDRHKRRGIYYKIKLASGRKQRGWLTNCHDLLHVIRGVNGLITKLVVSAHHNGEKIYGTDYSAMASEDFIQALHTGPFAPTGTIKLRMCNGESLGPRAKRALPRGWRVVYWEGVNGNLPGTPLETPRFLLRAVGEVEWLFASKAAREDRKDKTWTVRNRGIGARRVLPAG